MNFLLKAIPGIKALQRHLEPRNYYLNHPAHLCRQLFEPRFECLRLSGLEKHSGSPMKILYLGEGNSLSYLKTLFFQTAPAEEIVRKYSFVEMVRGVSLPLSGHDACVREMTPRLIRLSRTKSGFSTPDWIEQEIVLNGSWDDVVARFRKNTRSTDLRKVRKYNFSHDVVTDRENIEYFHDHLYLPYVNGRFQDAAEYINREWLIAVASGSGLLRILDKDRFLAGVVLHYERNFLDWIWVGALAQDVGDLEKGVFSSLYYHSIRHAHEKGFKKMKMGNSRTFLNDGVYRYKRKWGAQVVSSRYANTRLLFDFDFNSTAIRQWLEACPFLTAHGSRFSANIFSFNVATDSQQLLAKMSDIFSPGMDRINVYSDRAVEGLPRDFESCEIRHVRIGTGANASGQ